MRKIFITLILMLSVFSIANAHPFKTEKELDNFFSQIDKRIKEELKKNYREEYSKRKISADNEYSFEIEDDGSSFFTRNIDMKPKTEITQYFNKKGELYMISSLTGETDKELYALYRKYDKNGNLFIYTYAIDGKNTDKGYYSDGKLAYIKELKIVKGEAPIQNGKYIEYYKNGQIKVQGHYKDGKREGEFKTFLRNSKNAGSVFYKNGKIIKSTLINSMKDNASFSILTDINYNSNSHEIVTDEFPNGLLKQYFTFNKDELLDGESRQYYEEGDIKSISPFKNNVADGTFISYYQNGKLEEKYFMKNGKLDGEAINYFEDGRIKNKAIFKDGVTLEEEIYKDNEIRKNTFKNEEIVQQDIYSKNKILKAKKFFLENGKMKIISYYENGNKEEEVFVINELFDGEAFKYYPSGKLRNKSFFKDGKREGESLTYYENGKLKKKILYKNGVRNGEAAEYYESGIIKQKAYFINDKLEKEDLYYDEKGNLTKTEIYKNGVKQ
ncbi:toxin-antitoxin system YwqK family antitoxin [Fusobacterium nucleatum]|uniref:toxin-antitoxin system YwqK family antitoxin n=2 Tax=Fusobacterium nucleatum TaxID=851 RepID=UPI00201AC030|nr:toxin-antitoxin system YwqK family antitoxin [Fusobacterium nucleatum]MCL4582792.1 phophatidylinositol-4-phosphate 5-kinase [Fusobacterium nucleatum YWH7054]